MCSRALWTVLPCGSSTAFFGVMIIFAFMRNGLILPVKNRSAGCEELDRVASFFQRSTGDLPNGAFRYDQADLECGTVVDPNFDISKDSARQSTVTGNRFGEAGAALLG